MIETYFTNVRLQLDSVGLVRQPHAESEKNQMNRNPQLQPSVRSLVDDGCDRTHGFKLDGRRLLQLRREPRWLGNL